MKTKKSAKKSAKSAAKPRPTPLRFEGPADEFPISVSTLLSNRTSKQLAEDLRSRGLPIPKDKADMVMRLADHLIGTAAVLTATII